MQLATALAGKAADTANLPTVDAPPLGYPEAIKVWEPLTDEQIGRLGRFTAPPLGYPERMNIEQNAIDVGTVRLRRT